MILYRFYCVLSHFHSDSFLQNELNVFMDRLETNGNLTGMDTYWLGAMLIANVVKVLNDEFENDKDFPVWRMNSGKVFWVFDFLV